MTQFYTINIAPTREEIENSVREDGGILRGFGFGFDMPGECQEAVGGWEVRLVDKRGMGNHGCFIAVATAPETLKLQKAATMRLLRERADAAAANAALPDDEGLPYPEVSPTWGYDVERNNAALATRQAFRERGDFDCCVVPLLSSPLFERKGQFLFADNKWAYFAHSNSNYLRVGDGQHRLWVRPVK